MAHNNDTREFPMAENASRTPDLLLHAAELMAECGFAGMSMRQLAARCGLQSGSLYHHVASKQDLLLDVLLEVLAQRLAAWHNGSFSRDVPGYLRFLLARQRSHPHEDLLLRHEARHLTSDQWHWLDQAQGRLRAPLLTFIDQARRGTPLRCIGRACASEAIFALVETAHGLRRRPGPVDEAGIEAWLIQASTAVLGA